MSTIRRQRDIIDRKTLAGRLDGLAGWSGYSPSVRAEVLEMVKAALTDGQAEIRRRFEDEGGDGAEVVASGAYLIDQLIRAIHDFAALHVYPAANPTTAEQLSIVATGGYGRGELAPYSDIDLMFVLPYKQTAHTEQVIEFMLYLAITGLASTSSFFAVPISVWRSLLFKAHGPMSGGTRKAGTSTA